MTLMIPLYVVALFAHWVADFPVQSIFHRHMGQKATRLSHLLTHAFGYGLAFMFTVFLLFPEPAYPGNWRIVQWVWLNAILHGAIDFWTSKATAHCWERSDIRPMATAGIDWATKHTTIVFEQKPMKQRWIGAFFTTIGFDQWLHLSFLLWSGFEMGVL